MLADIKLALRSLLKTPGFTALALITLALGIGVNTSMFTVLNTLLLHQPAYPQADALIRVFRSGPTFQFAPHSPANFLDLRDRTKSFDGFAAFASGSLNFGEPGRPAEQLRGLSVTGDFFAVLGVNPALGRFLTAEDDQPGHDKVVVLSDPFWRRLGSDPAIVGRQIRADGELVTVVGVMPAGFDDALVWGDVAVWRPMAFNDDTRANRGGNWLSVIGRLKPGVTSGQALAELSAVNAALAAAYPETNAQTGVNLVPFVRSMQDNAARTMSLFVMGLAGCVLLIACVNLANLLFARNVLRTREYAIRAALGASRLKLVRHSLAESLLLALTGGLLGLLLAAWINPLLGAQISIAGRAGIELSLDPRVIGFSLAAAMASAVGFGFLPALLVSRTNVNHALKQGTRGSTSVAHHRIRHALIVIEVALALVLLSGAGFFLRGLDRFLNRDQGWRTTGLLTANLSLPSSKYASDEALVAYYDRLESRLAALPGVERVSLSRTLPFYGFGWGQRFIVEGQALPEPGREPMRDVNGVSPGYFETMGITLLEGRGFTPADLTGPVRTVISESMARNLWPGESAIGKRIAHPLNKKQWQEVIGVVREVKFASNLDNTGGRFQTYRLFAREPDAEITVALRCVAPPDTLAETLRQAAAEIDPEVPVSNIRPADLVVEQNLSNYALAGRMLTGFALLGLLLAAVGIYGVISGYVAQRTGEIGIRMALGAQWRDVIRLVLGQGLRLALIGAAVGLMGAWGVARLLKSAVPALPASEPLLVAGVLLLLLATTLFACWLPAQRAAKVDPNTALRAE